MFKTIKNFFKDIIDRSAWNADQPYRSRSPEEMSSNANIDDNGFYKEFESDIQNIAGTSINFGHISSVNIDENGNAISNRQSQGHILGSGILVSNLNPTIKDDIQLPGVGGVCHYCKQQSFLLLQENLISLEDAQRMSLFDSNSGSQCDGCGRKDLCTKHSRPYSNSDGQIISLCPDCTIAAEKSRQMSMVLNILLSPIIKTEKLLPPGEDNV